MIQHKAKREVVKAKQREYDKLYDRLDTKEGEKYLSTGEAEEWRWEGCAAG